MVIHEGNHQEFSDMFDELSLIVFKKHKKITRHRLRHSLKNTGFELSFSDLNFQLYLPYEIMKCLELSRDNLIQRNDFLKATKHVVTMYIEKLQRSELPETSTSTSTSSTVNP
jgi:hypothetical protein